ncbi:MAG: DivIVA domain-containing protein [Oscillospiraceae bacterium]|nr:DivIVA domain-containing protein [Oscillospiraceae bacterium]
MTPNEIHNKRFEKAMSGYRPEDVGVFLAEVADYVEELIDAKTELEQKILVLAEKLEEYREDEDSLRAALIGAQKLGDNVVRESKRKAEELIEEAKQKSQAMIEEASQKSDSIVIDIKKNVERETDTLNKMQAEVARFKSQILAMYRQHIEMVKSIPYDEDDFEYPIQPAKPEAENPEEPQEEVEEILLEESYREASLEYEPDEDAQAGEQPKPKDRDFVISFDDEVPESPFDIVRNEQLKKDDREDEEEPQKDYPKRESRHGNLLFGDKYTLTRKD